jgi:hypothetical protein
MEPEVKLDEIDVNQPVTKWYPDEEPIEKAEKKAKSTASVSAKGVKGYTQLIQPGYQGLQPLGKERRLGASATDALFVKPYIMAMMKAYPGEVVSSSDVARTLKNDFNINVPNLTSLWKRIMKHEPNIENIGFGKYKYEEKNFKPTV